MREVALKILHKIYTDKSYSNLALDDELNRFKMDKRDRALVSKIVYGTITYQIALDYIIEQYSNIKLKKISPWILCILRMGIYQIIYLDKIPKPAVVNESVNLAKKYGHKASSGFVNAILKKIDKEELQKLSFENDIDRISILTSHEKWFVELLLKEYTIEEVQKICEYNNIEPPVYIRVNTLNTNINEVINQFSNAKQCEVENVLEVVNIYDAINNDMFVKGCYTVQDIAATLVGNIVNPMPNEDVLDLCSAPGGKTTHLAEIMKNTGKIIACDIYENRLKLVEEAAKRLGITNIKTIVNDGTVLNKDFVNRFDKVLLDVPCSGFGVIRRKVDIKYQRVLEDIDNISKIQCSILENASKYVKVSGEIVYSTCTILKAENEEIIERFLKENTNFELIDISKELNNNCCKEKYIRTLPHVQNYDGFFIAKLIRKQ